MKKEVSTQYQVSKNTELFFQCIRLNSYFFGKVSEAVEMAYGATQADKVMEEFAHKWHDVEIELERLTMDNISDALFIEDEEEASII